MNVRPIVQQVPDHPEVTTATGRDQGCVPVVPVLDIELVGIFSEEAIEVMDVSVIGRLTGRLRRRSVL